MFLERHGGRAISGLPGGLAVVFAWGATVTLAQAQSVQFQLCQAQAPQAATEARIETNYRYPSSAVTRKPESTVCAAAWVQSPDIFNAIDICPFFISGCSADSSNTCNDNPEDWVTYDFFGARNWSDAFSSTLAWIQNPDVKIYSGVQGVEQWTRHKWWGWATPTRYEYMGVVERPVASQPGSFPKCYGMAYLVGFFNGVWTTRKHAEAGLKAMKARDFIGLTYRGAGVRYHAFYNQTGCSSTIVGCLEDVAEVFIQRSAELDGALERRWEYFWEQVTGQVTGGQSFTEQLRTRLVEGIQAFEDWIGALGTALLAKFTALAAQMLANPPTSSDTATHVADLVRYGQQAYRAVLVGHSQGNLFASAAKDGYLKYAREEGAAAGHDTGYVAAQVVHVAPASAVLQGPHVLAEIDLVINGLRRVDGTPVAVNTLGKDTMPVSSRDPTGHFFVETYLDPSRPARNAVKQLIQQSMDAL